MALKLNLISSVSPYFHKAHLLLSADCAAFSCDNFHSTLLRNRILIIGCPELDGAGYIEKLTEIFRSNDILSIAVVRMDAPCCLKLADMVVEAVRKSKKDIQCGLIRQAARFCVQLRIFSPELLCNGYCEPLSYFSGVSRRR
jgi:hypothetical protein